MCDPSRHTTPKVTRLGVLWRPGCPAWWVEFVTRLHRANSFSSFRTRWRWTCTGERREIRRSQLHSRIVVYATADNTRDRQLTWCVILSDQKPAQAFSLRLPIADQPPRLKSAYTLSRPWCPTVLLNISYSCNARHETPKVVISIVTQRQQSRFPAFCDDAVVQRQNRLLCASAGFRTSALYNVNQFANAFTRPYLSLHPSLHLTPCSPHC